MTGPHLTPKREAELRAVLDLLEEVMAAAGCLCLSSRCPLHGKGTGICAQAHNAITSERRAHDQARTALVDSTETLIAAESEIPRGHYELRVRIDAQIQANQVVLGLALPATEDT